MTKLVAAFRITEEMHHEIKNRAQCSNRKFQDEVRHLIRKGLESSQQVEKPNVQLEKNLKRLLNSRIMELEKSMKSFLLVQNLRKGKVRDKAKIIRIK